MKDTGTESGTHRRRLPDVRYGTTKRATACGFKYYVTVNFFEDGAPGEVFVTIAKEGSAVAGFVNTWATTMSIAFQFGTLWDTLYTKYEYQTFEPRDDINPSLVHAIAGTINEIMKEARHASSTRTKK